MRELSLNILDISMNSVKAGATEILIELIENETDLVFKIVDNGKGMTKEFQKTVTDPFTTSRKTRKVGLGLPFLKLAAEQTGGGLTISSKTKDESTDGSHGTEVVASFKKTSIDFTPLGDITSTIVTLVQGSPEIDFVYHHKVGETSIKLDTKELVEVLGDRSMLTAPEVLMWISESLNEQYDSIGYIKY